MVGNDAVNLFDLLGQEGIDGVFPGASDRIGNNHIPEQDENRIATLEAARKSVKDLEWDEMDDAGIYGAALAFSLTIHGVRVKPKYQRAKEIEYGGTVCCKCYIGEDQTSKFRYKITPPYTNLFTDALAQNASDLCPKGYTKVGGYHSHPTGGTLLKDADFARRIDRRRELRREKTGSEPDACELKHPKWKEYVGTAVDRGQYFRIATTGGGLPPNQYPLSRFAKIPTPEPSDVQEIDFSELKK
jgi:hypothetical protein